jgi:anti-anti-sigma factor
LSGGEPAAASLPQTDVSSKYNVETLGGAHIITFTTPTLIDAAEIEQLADELRIYVQGFEGPRVVIDMASINHLSSQALGMLIRTKAAVDSRQGSICVANLHDDLREVFRITKLHKTLKVHKSVEAAIKSIS